MTGKAERERKGQYRRLRWKLIAVTVALTLALVALGWALTVVLRDPFAHTFLALGQSWAGLTPDEALGAYQTWVVEKKALWVLIGVFLAALLASAVTLGYAAGLLGKIHQALGRIRAGSGDPVALPSALHTMEKDLEGLRQTLAQKEREARAAEERRQELIAFLAHDLKTPLTSVLGYLKLLNDEPDLDPESRRKYTGVALDKAERLEDLVGEFFDFTRLDLSQSAQAEDAIQLSLLLEQIADEFYPVFGEKDLTCQAEIAPHLMVKGDPDKLARVFDNVLRNAISYSTPGGVVELWAGREGEQVRVVIRNEGLDIPEGELTNIFEKFYRLDAARSSRTGGAGLGLAIAKEIVEHHGGTIRAESDGRRTSFTITLPAMKGVAL